MIKTLTRFVAGLTAAAALLLAAGCTNQLDYVDDTTALNKFNVVGLKVTGLDAAYNGADINLMVVRDPETDPIGDSYVRGKVASSYTDDKGNTVGYKSGTAYIKLDTPELYDGDSLHTSKFECYLSVGSDTIKVLSSDGTTLENAKLSVPTSDAGTRDADLKSKFVSVVVTDGIGTFSLVDKVDEPVNVTMYMVKMDLLECTKENLPTGVTVETKAKAGTNQKFTLKMIGLKENAGKEVVLGGSDISATDGNLGNNWYDDTKFKQTISDDGEVSWTFYGSAVNGGNISAWNRIYKKEQAGPEIVINAVSDKKENGNRLLMSNVSRNGKKGDSENFMFPAYTIGNFDVELTIDVSKINTDSWEKADPIAPAKSFTVSAIYIENAPITGDKVYLTTPDGFGSQKQKDSDWKLPGNTWSNACHSYSASDLINGNFEWSFDEAVELIPYKETFAIGIRLIDSDGFADEGGGNDFWKGDITSGGYCSPYYSTEDMADGIYTLYVKYNKSKTSATVTLIPTSVVSFDYKIRRILLVGATDALSVSLAGSFNGWKPNVKDYRMLKEESCWTFEANFTEAATFKFVIDSNWIGTSSNDSSWAIDDGYGGLNLGIIEKPAKIYDLKYTLNQDNSKVISCDVCEVIDE